MFVDTAADSLLPQKFYCNSILTLSHILPVCEEPVRVEWDTEKEQANITKHGVDFTEATDAFYDPQKLIEIDAAHSGEEPRLLCIGRTERGILTVRFTYRGETIRIIGAGYWRKGRRTYEKENPIEN